MSFRTFSIVPYILSYSCNNNNKKDSSGKRKKNKKVISITFITEVKFFFTELMEKDI